MCGVSMRYSYTKRPPTRWWARNDLPLRKTQEYQQQSRRTRDRPQGSQEDVPKSHFGNKLFAMRSRFEKAFTYAQRKHQVELFYKH